MDVLTARDWPQFIALADELDGWAFRGQQVASWPLLSSLSRRLAQFCPDAAGWPERERRAMRIFRRKAHIYLEDRAALDEDLRCLAMMQHHGAPTRLLDFTKSPFVAAFFALERAVGDAAVYALNTPALWQATPRFDATLTRDRIDPRHPGHFERYFIDNQHPLLWFGEPSRMDRRLVAQSGLFVVPGQLQQPLAEILDHYASDAPLLKKIVLPAALRDQAMHALYRMNVTHATLFPDLDGLARSIAYELEVVWPGPPAHRAEAGAGEDGLSAA
ncbi:FRG domain-containing protein [Caldimonas brevitalea]|uniref:FRG domain-containing protein n=1 Tax=Caldimonas brevitalea TaxID=413882 RepID=A0A0G3BQ37_9BURK|nr:FRG domain-containing protein [Caldimonas brevitalea]AKJ31539.1 hypothetical protein AAW51_4848 [Caldimonas brevitalea]